MAGRNISVSHTALGTVRVMRTTGMMGEVVGMAAYLCKKHKRLSPGHISAILGRDVAVVATGNRKARVAQQPAIQRRRNAPGKTVEVIPVGGVLSTLVSCCSSD